MIAAIEYARPAPPPLHGTNPPADDAADEFLKAWFRYGTQNRFICRPSDVYSYNRFKELAQAAGIDIKERCVGLDPLTPQHNLETISCLFRPDAALTDMLWRRRQLQGTGYAACGYLQGLTGAKVAQTVTDLCLAPATSADALVCSSNAMRGAVRKLWDIHADYLNYRFGGTFRCPIQTPVIPFGIDTSPYLVLTSSEKRMIQRMALGATDQEVIVLAVGSPNPSAHAHPLPLLLAAEHAARNVFCKLRIVLSGYFRPNDEREGRLRAMARDICQTVRCDLMPEGDDRFPHGLWAAADIFASLADNVHESLDRTALEAMACGLPSVVSDWNGYRDYVRDTQEGFLIPTHMPPDTAGLFNAFHYYNEGKAENFLTGAAQSTMADIRRAASAFISLANGEGKRRAMGEAARARAQSVFDWRVIVPSFEALWRKLSSDAERERPSLNAFPRNWAAASPAVPNPWTVWSGFATAPLSPLDRVRVVMTSEEISIILEHDMNMFVPELLVPKASLLKMAEAIRQAGAVRIQDMLRGDAAREDARLWRCFAWMLKHGVCIRELS